MFDFNRINMIATLPRVLRLCKVFVNILLDGVVLDLYKNVYASHSYDHSQPDVAN